MAAPTVMPTASAEKFDMLPPCLAVLLAAGPHALGIGWLLHAGASLPDALFGGTVAREPPSSSRSRSWRRCWCSSPFPSWRRRSPWRSCSRQSRPGSCPGCIRRAGAASRRSGGRASRAWSAHRYSLSGDMESDDRVQSAVRPADASGGSSRPAGKPDGQLAGSDAGEPDRAPLPSARTMRDIRAAHPDPADKRALRERMDRLENRGARVSRRALIRRFRRRRQPVHVAGAGTLGGCCPVSRRAAHSAPVW